MRRIVWFSAMWLLVSVAAAWGQDDDHDPSPVDEVSTPPPAVEIPERKIEFVHSDEPYEMALFRADPALLEKRFVAEIVIAYAGEREQPSPRLRRSLASSTPFRTGMLRQLWHYPANTAEWSLIFPGHHQSALVDPVRYYSDIARRTRSTKQGQESAEFFGQAAIHRYLQFTPSYGFDRPESAPPSTEHFALRLLVPTVQRGEELAIDLLRLFDEGVSRPSMIEVLRQKGAVEQTLAKTAAEELKVVQKLTDLNKPFEGATPISGEDLNRLRTQQHLTDVDLAGVRARIEAADEILAGKDLPASRIEQVENIKITAQIDLASLAARRKALGEIIDQGSARIKLLNELRNANARRNNLRNRVSEHEYEIQQLSELYDLVGPLRVYENKVVIRPIRWKELPASPTPTQPPSYP